MKTINNAFIATYIILIITLIFQNSIYVELQNKNDKLTINNYALKDEIIFLRNQHVSNFDFDIRIEVETEDTLKRSLTNVLNNTLVGVENTLNLSTVVGVENTFNNFSVGVEDTLNKIILIF